GVRVFKRRWCMLALYCIYSFINAYEWIHLNIIGNMIERYYNESLPSDEFHRQTTIDWLATSYLAIYVPLIIPGIWLLNKYGLKVNILLGAVINALGAWIKCIGLAPERFYLVMIGQWFCAICNAFVVSLPPFLSAVWFGPNELSTATAIGVFGNLAGIAVGFLLPPVMVPNSPDITEVRQGLEIMYYSCAACSTLIVLLIIIFFKKEPPIPPSHAQLYLKEKTEDYHYGRSLKKLFKQPSFNLLTLCYGIITGVDHALLTLLDFIILHYFPGEEVNAGRIGLVIVLAGIIPSILSGVWLDKTKTYKATSVLLYICTVIGVFVFTFTLDYGKIWIVFITSCIIGFFMFSYLPVGYEVAAEITYPEPEATSAGILTACAMFLGMVFTNMIRVIMSVYGVFIGNIAMGSLLILGAVINSK
ncbi:hypothetical protein LOTGIDRAFT_107425, partial [Lottia gigantea]